jgi:hypothetical protein
MLQVGGVSMSGKFESTSDLVEFARTLQAEASSRRAVRTVIVLDRYFSGYWSSSLEALGELKSALHEIEDEVTKCFPSEIADEMRAAVSAVDRFVNRFFRC